VTADGALGSASGRTTVSAGATLAFSGGVNYATPEPVTIAGAGLDGAGALSNLSGANVFAGPVTLGATPSIGSVSGSLKLTGILSGAAAWTKVGAGTVTLAATNTATGQVTVGAGALLVDGVSRVPVSIGDGAALGGTSARWERWAPPDRPE